MTARVLDCARAASDIFKVPLKRITGEDRNRNIVRARWAAMMVAKEITEKSTTVIGSALKRDHTTVLHGVREGTKLMEEDPDYADMVKRTRATALIYAQKNGYIDLFVHDLLEAASEQIQAEIAKDPTALLERLLKR